ncbi:hypothetical protein ACFOZ0_30170 [Streptomyces yaanensis]|uniref:Uncharacterized protein n=1 Tax=Streptomyces yaanensis TaxID=1142239 RepID=A0ABV7SMB1_9ACTN|nr:hypothetical protein [Streptomyces sp. CGMCC 4.7035]WNC00402.1 hypothetical protein Q2K21_21360 [Streptomyces sp. CGMCC 4.7035]
MSIPDLSTTRRIAPPEPDVEPLKVNVYEQMAKAASQLAPLFPYDHAGAIVPCGNVLVGGPGQSYGQFFHWNTVSEVVVCYGSRHSPLAPGQIIATQNLHGVNSRLSDETDSDAAAVLVVTQHQAEKGDQTEAMIAKCTGCHAELLRHEYDASPPSAPHNDVRQFPTTVGSARFAELRNTDEVRTCRECGLVNDPFSVVTWGWARQVAQTTAVQAAQSALRQAASVPST